jgi:hypothetical protein
MKKHVMPLVVAAVAGVLVASVRADGAESRGTLVLYEGVVPPIIWKSSEAYTRGMEILAAGMQTGNTDAAASLVKPYIACQPAPGAAVTVLGQREALSLNKGVYEVRVLDGADQGCRGFVYMPHVRIMSR